MKKKYRLEENNNKKREEKSEIIIDYIILLTIFQNKHLSYFSKTLQVNVEFFYYHFVTLIFNIINYIYNKKYIYFVDKL